MIAALDATLLSVPQDANEQDERIRLVSSLRDVLAQFGIDGENLIRYGMPSRAALSVYRAMILPDDDELTQMIDTPRWRAILRVPTPPEQMSDLTDADAEAMATAITHIPQQLDRWVASARMDDVLRYAPPSDADWAAWALVPRESDDTLDAYRWLWQRSTVETLARWALSSLHLEYRWQNSHQVGMFSEVALSAAGPTSVELNAEIAKRAVEPRFQETFDQDRLFWELQDTAVEYLTKGKYVEAVALFEFHLRRNPNDSKTLNNLGFCSMPLDPGTALHWLKEADANGYLDTAIAVYNQCCCLVRLNRTGDALDKAEYYWQRQRQTNPLPGFLWIFEDGEWVLSGDAAPEVALADLAIRAAEALGRDERRVKWEERRRDLGVGAPSLPSEASDAA